ncbi:MAG: phage portal protein [Ruminococcaceae bacterium]|nr:phage portal protein [Oscillospiraceae bacterium]
MIPIKTYQDLEQVKNSGEQLAKFLLEVITDHKMSELYRTAEQAVLYDQRRNPTIEKFQKILYTLSGKAVPDTFRANHKLKSNFFNRFVTHENQYLLGNGVTLGEEENKAKLGRNFDVRLQEAGQAALVQGLSFGFWNLDHLEVFQLMEFAPLWDEETGQLRAGVRFWQLDSDRPLRVTLYEEDGCTEYIKRKGDSLPQVKQEKRGYKQTVLSTAADGVIDTINENHSRLPIVPLYGNPHHQSELVGMQEAIDCYDLIKSGFANDLDQASMIYWVLKNSGGMDDVDLAKFLERMKTVGAAALDSDEENSVEAHTLDVPYQSRTAYLEKLRNDLYDDAQALNISQLSGGSKTATEINAAYEALDLKTTLFEYQVLDFLEGIFALAGIEDNATFKRSRIVNQLEETQMVMLAAEHLDEETLLNKLSWLTPEEVSNILENKAGESLNRFGAGAEV